MSSMVGDNPVLMSGVIVSAGGEPVVIGDGLGNSVAFRWTDAATPAEHGSPSALVVDFPMDQESRIAGAARLSVEGKATQVRYVIDRIDENLRTVSYTVIEDITSMLREAESPGLARRSPGEGPRLSVGFD